MLSQTQILFGLLLPSALAAILAIIGWLISGKSWGATLGVPVALALAYKPMTGSFPAFPPPGASDWPLFLIFPIAVIALFERRIPWPVRPPIVLCAAATLAWLTLRPVTPGPLATAVVPIIALIVWCLIEPLAIRRPGVTAPILLWLISTGCAMLLLLGAGPKQGFLSVTFAGIFGAYFVVALIIKKTSLSCGPSMIAISLLASWLAYAHFDSNVITIPEISLVAIAPALAWIVEISPLDKWKPWKRELLRTALVAAPIIAAIILAAIQFKKDSAGMEM